ncbi:homoserine dehydrogenase [SAR86 cluster bacterium SAR86E]|jgi:homoserine dehydrogenase|uniref:Homoserine dehydrogenase n=1 Tax=SAR86 cluster bacterium SAR86E TaxID=1208365 RepID=K6H1C8_9GAMM|nr:homoserine dehydrogenase [SAR86 cluster bacterium SAR86E]
MTILKIGICGWGNVATGLFEQLTANNHISSQWQVTCIGARRDNPRCDPGSVKILRDIFAVPDEEIDVLIELIGGVDTAKALIIKALNAKKHVITANKAVIFEHGEELLKIAKNNDVRLLFESAVCAGTPTIKMLSNDLSANVISKVAGMLNGTTNFILSNMEEGELFETVLAEAKAEGYAEPDPTLDINGTDAAHKIGILAALIFNSGLPATNFHIEGIENISPDDFLYADEFGLTIKHLAVACKNDLGIELRSHPVMIKKESSLAGLKGVRNGIQFDTDLIGSFHVAGSGAGRESTASGLISDLVALSKSSESLPMQYPDFSKKPDVIDFNELSFKYYVYLEVKDQPGVLATISKVFGDHGISLEKVIQKDQLKNGYVPVVIITDNIVEKEMQIVMSDFLDQDVVSEAKIIRIEDL